MKAKIQPNNQLLNIPDIYAGWGNFKNASVELQQSYGFYEVVQPILTEDKMCGNPYFDEENKVITFYVVDKPIVPPINPLMIFDKQKCKDDLGMLFIRSLSRVSPWYSILMSCIDNLGLNIDGTERGVKMIRFYIVNDLLLNSATTGFTEDDKNKIYQAFLNQNINLNDY